MATPTNSGIQTDSDDDRSLDTAQAADFLGVSPRSMERWRLQKVGPPYFKLSPRAIRYSLRLLREFRDGCLVR